MKDFNEIFVTDGVSVVSVPTNRFKTNEIAIAFASPLSADTASVNAVLINMLANSTKKYPDMLSLNKKLAMLYGATVTASVIKLGENQIVKLTASSLDDRFSLENSKISAECLELLFSMIFDANLDENGDFYEDDINRQKRIVIEKIESENNEKRVYSLRRLEQIMFENEPYAVNRYGTVESVNAVTNADLKKALNDLVTKARVMVTTVGTADCETVVDSTKKAFSNVKRDFAALGDAVFVPTASDVKTVSERIDVKQGKLVLGFRVNVEPNSELTPVMRALCDVFGGGPYSKLFANVREKLSLCYYCSARYDRRKSNIIIQCGCEEENMDKAVDEILNQLNEIKKGNFDTELEASKMGLCDSIKSVEDDSIYLLSWYDSQVVDNAVKSPTMSANEHLAVTKEQIIDCASLISLDTIFKLCSTKEGE